MQTEESTLSSSLAPILGGSFMYFKFGVDSFIWAENFSEKDLWVISKAKELGFEVIDFAIANPFTFPLEQVKAELDRVGIDCVCTTTLTAETNPISPDAEIRQKAVEAMKKCVDICNYLNAPILGGVNYAGWGYLTKKPRTEQEWNWGVENMRQVAEYAKATGNVTICVECVNRFETHFLNIAEDAVKFCKDVGTGNMKVHLDCFHLFLCFNYFLLVIYPEIASIIFPLCQFIYKKIFHALQLFSFYNTKSCRISIHGQRQLSKSVSMFFFLRTYTVSG